MRRSPAAGTLDAFRELASADQSEQIHGDLARLEKVDDGLELLVVAIGGGKRGVRAGKPVRADHAAVVSGVVRSDLRHVAVLAAHRLRRVVERARSLAGDAARLPVVVFVEAPDPAIAVHRDVEVHLVAARTEGGAVALMKRLQERAPVRLGVELQEKVVDRGEKRIVAGREIVERRVLDGESALAHGVLHVHDGVAGHAAESDLRLGRVDHFRDRAIHEPGEEERVVVATGAPLGGADAGDALHVLDRLPVPLVVERSEVVRGRIPFLIDVHVAARLPAGLGLHEELALRNELSVGGSRRGWKERTLRASHGLARHRDRRADSDSRRTRADSVPAASPGETRWRRRRRRSSPFADTRPRRPRRRGHRRHVRHEHRTHRGQVPLNDEVEPEESANAERPGPDRATTPRTFRRSGTPASRSSAPRTT